ncbi:hypothetical protein ACN4EE_20665 [Geminocystis sp. CENA526]|uniref:hypothetical protein n=1 Tax=Geminocystis sp. CENA526 TaxID=1355871 RepID=UPI003D6FB5A5
MDNWENSLLQWLNQVERQLQSLSNHINRELETKLDELTQEIEETLTTELNQFLTEVDDFVIDVFDFFLDENYREFDEDENNELDELQSLFQDDKPQPHPQKHPACVGCIHYHGQTYNGNLLVCAMHPFGWDDEKCPDWEN